VATKKPDVAPPPSESLLGDGQSIDVAGGLASWSTAETGQDVRMLPFGPDTAPWTAPVPVFIVDVQPSGTTTTGAVLASMPASASTLPAAGIEATATLLLVAGLADKTGPSLDDALTYDATIGGRAIDSVAVTDLAGAIDGGARVDLAAELQADGRFRLSPAELAVIAGGTLSPGTHTLDLTALDADANATTVDVTFTLDTAPPSFSAGLADDTGFSATDGITNDDAIGGTVGDAAGVVALVGTLDQSAAFMDFTGLIGAGGTFEISPADLASLAGGTIAEGHHALTLQAVDAAGNVTTTTTSFTLVTSVSVTGLGLVAAEQTDGVTNAASGSVLVVGTTTPGATIELDNTGAFATAGSNGGFQFAGVALMSGSNALTFTATDPAGNTTTGTLDVTRSATTGGPDAVQEWIAITNQAITNDASAPTYASRALAMVSLAQFDAISAIDGTPGYLINVTAPAGASAQAAAVVAADQMLDGLFPAQSAAFDAQAAIDLAAIPDSQNKTDGMTVGGNAVAAIIATRANDGSTDSVIDNGSTAVGQWRPTAPAYAPALDPQWANVTPFALQSPNQFLPPAPPSMGSAVYAAAVNETESLGAADSTTRTADETQIAKFWNDQTGTDTPAGQWNQIASVVATQAGDSLAQDALLFAELNVGEADAGIAAFNGKYTYNAWRPITAIQNASETGNTAIVEDPTWTPLLTTPNFPEYPEGHGTFSGTAATILASFFGNNTSFTVGSESLAGVTRSYTSFSEAADEAAMSRIYGGIHFSFSAAAAPHARRRDRPVDARRIQFQRGTPRRRSLP
jgi:hypothetical protein